jgi:pantoate--beta-alanine ligase
VQATALSRALRAGAAAADGGPDAVLAAARRVADAAHLEPDYLALTDPDLGEPARGRDARLMIAARVGKPRLIDNLALTLGGA